MQVRCDKNARTLVLSRPEQFFLLNVLIQIVNNYEQAPPQLDPRVREIWYAPPMMEPAPDDEEDRLHWMESLRDFRLGNGALGRRYLQELEQARGEPVELRILREELEPFLILMNDHRLYQAAIHGVGELEMELALDEVQDPARRHALLEIHFLAALVEILLELES